MRVELWDERPDGQREVAAAAIVRDAERDRAGRIDPIVDLVPRPRACRFPFDLRDDVAEREGVNAVTLPFALNAPAPTVGVGFDV